MGKMVCILAALAFAAPAAAEIPQARTTYQRVSEQGRPGETFFQSGHQPFREEHAASDCTITYIARVPFYASAPSLQTHLSMNLERGRGLNFTYSDEGLDGIGEGDYLSAHYASPDLYASATVQIGRDDYELNLWVSGPSNQSAMINTATDSGPASEIARMKLDRYTVAGKAAFNERYARTLSWSPGDPCPVSRDAVRPLIRDLEEQGTRALEGSGPLATLRALRFSMSLEKAVEELGK